MKKTVLCILLAFGATFGVVSYARFASADAPHVLVAQADAPPTTPPSAAPTLLDAGATAATAPAASGSATTAVATPTDSPPVLAPQAEDIGVVTKLWKNGSFFALGIIALYIGLAVWAKLDKKHAWYAVTAAGALALTIQSIRNGDTPTATSMVAVVGTLVGVLLKGPGHVEVPST